MISSQVISLAHDAWLHEMRGPHGEWVRGPGSAVHHESYGHGVVAEVSGRHATVRFDDGSVRQFGSLMEHEPVGEDAYFKAKVGPTQGETPDPEHLGSNLAPEIPQVDSPWGPRYGLHSIAQQDLNMVGYTSKGNGEVEKHLRAGEQPELPMHPDYVDTVIASRHLTQPTTLYRGIALSPELERKMIPGAVFSDKSYTSTTTAPQWADEFADFRITGKAPWVNKDFGVQVIPGKPARMVLHAPAGQEIGPGEPGLAEYVLPRDSKFRVTRLDTSPDGRVLVHADVLPHGEHAPLKQMNYEDPRDKWLKNRHIDPVTGAVTYGTANDPQRSLDFGWRYSPLEKRNEHGEWTRGGEITHPAGSQYRLPDHSRLLNPRSRLYLDPADHPFFKEHPVSAEHVMAVYDRTPLEFRQQGMRWYADAHSMAKAMGGGDADKAAGVIAAYSPQTSWPVNLLNAAHALELGRAVGPEHGDGGMITRSMEANAQKPFDGMAADEANHSSKTKAFARLIRNGGDLPDDQDGEVVIDRHAMSVAMGHPLPKVEADKAPIDKDRFYQHVADQYREAAIRLSERDGVPISPHQLQAMTWLQQQAENQAIDVEATSTSRGGSRLQRGRTTALNRAWQSWGEEVAQHHLPAVSGTTLLSQVLDFRYDPAELRDSRGRWTRFGGVGEAVDVMEHNREGFSVSPRTGSAPEHGFMVALEGHTHQYPAAILDDQEKLRRALDDMLMSERDSFQGDDMYLGGWVEDGKLWLDPSQNVQDRATAERLGKERDQVGIFSLDTFETINTGGSGGGNITEHALAWQGAPEGTGWLLGPARGRAAS